MQRVPVVADQFYPGNPDSLNKVLGEMIQKETAPRSVLGVMSPHAGYVYSGAIAGKTFGHVKIPETVLILGPNHHGLGHPASLSSAASWRTPMGEARVDHVLSKIILEECSDVAVDDSAHRMEHSLEVQVPFIQYLSPKSSICPLCIGHLPLNALLEMGKGIGRAIGRYDKSVLMVASTDMTHYEPGDVARKKDDLALAQVMKLDPSGLFSTVSGHEISMCGVLPVVVMLSAARYLGAKKAELVHYGNSGDVTGDQSEVVGYAGVIIE